MNQIYKIIFAITAVLASMCFIVLAGHIYANLYLGVTEIDVDINYFRLELTYNQLTMPLALITVLIPWVIAAMYYYVVDSVHLDRWWHWGVIMIVTGLLTGVSSWQYLLSHIEPLYSTHIISLSGWNALWGACVFILASFGIRWWSTNCRHTPIPQ